jgi:two-component system sensor histidine kinase YesM
VDEIRKIGAQVADMVDAFIGQEILNARATSTRLNQVVLITAGAEFLLLILALFYTRFAMNRLTDNIRTALSSLETTVRRIAEGDLRDRVSDLGVEELQELAEHINQMAERLETLIAETRRNQEHLAKAELRTLQAQINPHFLYNTLDAIVWQAESGRSEEVARLTRSLSDFFRISLSSGADWIPVSQEMKHVTAYLSIQQTRYRDILQYEVDSPPEGLESVYMLKLLLQPLVENALYHGVKLKRAKGMITVTGKKDGEDIIITVSDTGAGMTKDRLDELRAGLSNRERVGFGLSTVDERLKLFFGEKYGLSIESTEGEGTDVTVRIPGSRRNTDEA